MSSQSVKTILSTQQKSANTQLTAVTRPQALRTERRLWRSFLKRLAAIFVGSAVQDFDERAWRRLEYRGEIQERDIHDFSSIRPWML